MKRATLGACVLLAVVVSPATAQAVPKVSAVSALSANRVERGDESFYALSAVVRFAGRLSSDDRRHLGLIGVQWVNRDAIAAGTALPDKLFSGTALGSIGKASRHCYLAEVATFKPWRSVRPGRSWAVGVHNGEQVVRSAPRTQLQLRLSEETLIRQAGCA